ncbi:MAG: N-acetylmuramoyl-L-alanine amidase [Bacteroidota bacterium]
MKILPKTVFPSFLLVISLFGFGHTPLHRSDRAVKVIVIDAGHGGKDPGCHGAKVNERDITLKVALNVGRLIKENLKDVKVIYTRSTDVFIPLHDRADIANKNHADLFISIHCNSSPAKINGSETYVMGLHTGEGNLEVAKRENSVILKEENYMQKYDGFDPNSPLAHILFSNMQNAHLERSLNLAERIEGQFKNRMGRHSRGVRQAGFIVLWKTAMPSVLVEIGYLTDAKDEKYLKSDKGQDLISSAVFRAVRDYKAEMEDDE